MKEIIDKISEEIYNLKAKSKINFNDYFLKYNILQEDKMTCYYKIIENLKGWICIDKKYKNAVVGLPYNLTHIKNKKYIIEPNPINKDGIQSIINILKEEQCYNVIEPKVMDNGVTSMGAIEYNDKLLKLFRYMPFYEKDYNKNLIKIQSKDISSLSFKETQQYITAIYRNEKFRMGTIQQSIDNGTLLKLLEHFLSVC